MTTLISMADSSTPPPLSPTTEAYAVYLGGQTPHVWAEAEIMRLPCRWILPIWVNINPAGNATADAQAFIGRLSAYGWPKGVTVCLDTESLAQPEYVAAFNKVMTADGWRLVEYESKGPLGSNPPTSGGRWVADWTGVPHLFPGSVATQYASSAQAHAPWDLSVIEALVPLREIHPPAASVPPTVTVTMTLTVVKQGTSGPAVKALQGLLLVFGFGPDDASMRDGVCGPVTLAAIREAQLAHLITGEPGYAGARTWRALLYA